MSVSLDTADAVVYEINNSPSGTFSEAFTATRKVIPEAELSDLKTLTVTVVPQTTDIEMATRSATTWEMQINIGVQKLVGADLDADVESLSGVVEEIIEYLLSKRKLTQTSAPLVRIKHELIYSMEHLRRDRVFFSVVTATYRVMR